MRRGARVGCLCRARRADPPLPDRLILEHVVCVATGWASDRLRDDVFPLSCLNKVGASRIELALVVSKDFSINRAGHPVIDRAGYLMIIERGGDARCEQKSTTQSASRGCGCPPLPIASA